MNGDPSLDLRGLLLMGGSRKGRGERAEEGKGREEEKGGGQM